MIRTDKSVTFLTGMIIAALYVIMLVGFSRESYMRRDALAVRVDAWNVADDAANQMCRIDRPVCSAPSLSAADIGAARLRSVRFADDLPSR